MEAIDLVERTKEFQLLRVTKDLQSKIRGGSEENQQACGAWEEGGARGVRNGWVVECNTLDCWGIEPMGHVKSWSVERVWNGM